ncbi:hypothetical protein SAMN04490239_1074 [Rhodococcus koreensis]|uniref:Uncharacterized protein n=1 Tax=Rhodococcus koreensis TaxID=99653 RepID=A0A1H4L3U4_9NOCA|nr:hypothetical protein SAMN04490239_1074 [Rhodococcus koreensis]
MWIYDGAPETESHVVLPVAAHLAQVGVGRTGMRRGRAGIKALPELRLGWAVRESSRVAAGTRSRLSIADREQLFDRSAC